MVICYVIQLNGSEKERHCCLVLLFYSIGTLFYAHETVSTPFTPFKVICYVIQLKGSEKGGAADFFCLFFYLWTIGGFGEESRVNFLCLGATPKRECIADQRQRVSKLNKHEKSHSCKNVFECLNIKQIYGLAYAIFLKENTPKK